MPKIKKINLLSGYVFIEYKMSTITYKLLVRGECY